MLLSLPGQIVAAMDKRFRSVYNKMENKAESMVFECNAMGVALIAYSPVDGRLATYVHPSLEMVMGHLHYEPKDLVITAHERFTQALDALLVDVAELEIEELERLSARLNDTLALVTLERQTQLTPHERFTQALNALYGDLAQLSTEELRILHDRLVSLLAKVVEIARI